MNTLAPHAHTCTSFSQAHIFPSHPLPPPSLFSPHLPTSLTASSPAPTAGVHPPPLLLHASLKQLFFRSTVARQVPQAQPHAGLFAGVVSRLYCLQPRSYLFRSAIAALIRSELSSPDNRAGTRHATDRMPRSTEHNAADVIPHTAEHHADDRSPPSAGHKRKRGPKVRPESNGPVAALSAEELEVYRVPGEEDPAGPSVGIGERGCHGGAPDGRSLPGDPEVQSTPSKRTRRSHGELEGKQNPIGFDETLLQETSGETGKKGRRGGSAGARGSTGHRRDQDEGGAPRRPDIGDRLPLGAAPLLSLLQTAAAGQTGADCREGECEGDEGGQEFLRWLELEAGPGLPGRYISLPASPRSLSDLPPLPNYT